MTIVIDTSAYSTFNRGDIRLRQWFGQDHQLLVPLVVAGELRAGFAGGNRTEENELLFQKFLDSSNVLTLSLTDRTTWLFADVFNQLKKAGTPININDVWIACLAIEANADLLTTDSDFKNVECLRLIELSH